MNKKKPSINLSLFINNISESFLAPSNKSPRDFNGGVVGLGIVAAMNNNNDESGRSEPIPIVFAKPIIKIREPTPKPVVSNLSESYTCVISHLGKKEYFDDAKIGGGVFFTSSPKNTAHLFQTADFLSSCYLCSKNLHGLDIFMYRGDKAFCSGECRYKQILSDENRAKCGSGVLKSFAYSVSPCSTPSIFAAGVAAA